MFTYAFGPYVLDLSTRRLLRDDQQIDITAKIFETLAVLVQNRGRVMTKGELLAVLWPDTIVEEANLAQNISTLRRILQDTPKARKFIATIPGRGYSFVAPVAEKVLSVDTDASAKPDVAAVTPTPRSAFRRYYAPLGVLAATLLASLVLFRLEQRRNSPAFYSAVPLTAYAGHELTPSFSPDGQAVAFAWDGEERDNFDIYIKRSDLVQPIRVTEDLQPDIGPAWSPDGHTLAYLHVLGNRAEVSLIPARGGGARQVLTAISIQGEHYFRMRFLCWSRDGKFLALSDAPDPNHSASIYLLSVQTGEKTRLTFPPSAYDDFDPIFSPDMKSLAFVRYSGAGASAGDLYVLDLSTGLTPRGQPRRMTAFNRQSASPAWTPDGRGIIFARYDTGGSHSLLRVDARNASKVEPLAVAADNSSAVALSPSGHELVYTRESSVSNLWAVRLSAGKAISSASPWTRSTSTIANPQFSPDGKYVAYQSLRSGRCEIWVCNQDGSNPRQLTNLGAVVSGFPRWSPDSRRIAFHSRPNKLANLYVVDVAGGEPKSLTSGVSNEISPSWSRDGDWIYYSSKRTGEPQIWRIPAAGGAPEQVTRHSGYCPLESQDRRHLYFASLTDAALWRVALPNGQEEKVLGSVAGEGTAYIPARDGIFFVRPLQGQKRQELAFFRYTTGGTEPVIALPGIANLGLGLSPDEHLLLVSQIEQSDTDLILVQHFSDVH
jgi:Tol biopolymer transport system component/DNA-binding winged helix-turn-helix (wHTH) protein